MSHPVTKTTNPLAFVLMILVIATLVSLTGCSGSGLGRAAEAADATERLGDVLTATPAADRSETRRIF